MQSSWNPPPTAVVGQPIDLSVEFCSPADTATDHDVAVDGTPIISEAISSIAGQVCLGRGVGFFHSLTDEQQFNNDPTVEASNGNLVFTEPGSYTLTFNDYHLNESHTITVDPKPFDASLVDSSCSISAPDTTNPGDTVTLTATITNGNSDPGDVEVAFSFGSATETVETTVPANGSAEATAEFVPEEPGDFSPTVDHTVL